MVITASGDLLPQSGLAAGTVNVTGDNITLTSTGGEVGNPASPLLIQANSEPAANGGVVGGVVNATAETDVGLVQNSGDLLVGTIQSTGHGAVAVSAPGGSILNAATWVAGGLSLAQASATWNALGLTDPAQSQQTVTAFENQVDGNYQQYWQLLGSGTVQNRSFTVRAGTQAVWNNATGGQFTLSTTVDGQTETTAPIAYNASAAVMQTALAPLQAGSLTVTGSGTQADPWLISATGLGPLTTSDSQLTGGVSTVKPVPLGPQQVWTSATGGSFTLSAIVNGQIETTGPIDYNASAAAIQSALSQVGVPAAVTGLGTPADPWLISAATLPTLTINTANLTTSSTVQAAAAGTVEVWNSAAGGSFTISATVNGQAVTSDPIDYNASAAEVQTALIPLLGDTLTVTGSGTQADPWLITANGLPSLTTNDSLLLPSGTVQAAPALASTLWTSATGGQFTLSVIVNGQAETTGPNPYNASAATVQAALNSLAGVQATVTGSGTQADPWVLSGNGLTFLATNGGQLTGGASTLQVVPTGPQQMWCDATGGSFRISLVVNGQTETTGPIAYDASATAVQAALNTLTGVQATVTGLGTPGDPWLITGTGLAALMTDVSLLTTSSTVQAAPAGASLLWNSATGGTFTLSLTVNGQVVTTGPIAYNASAADVQMALDNLAGVQAAVTGSGTQADPWLIGGTGLSSFTTDDSLLTGGASTVQTMPAGAQWLWNHATGGQFTLSVIVNGQTETTAPIAYNASAFAVQAALNALTAVQAAVTGLGTPADPWLITGSGLTGLTIGDSGLIGGIAGGAYNLNPDALSAYSAQAAAVLGITTTPTAAQVQSYTNSCLQQVVSFFDANLPAGWMDQLDFQAYNPLYDYQATPDQVAALTLNSIWTEDELIYAIAEQALGVPVASSSPTTANIIGGTVTLTAGAGVGANREPEQIPLANIKSANLTADQKAPAGPGHPGG